MKQKLHSFLNLFIWAVFGVFCGRSLFRYLHYLRHPEAYLATSAPWYLPIMVNGLCTVLIVVIALFLRFLLRRMIDRENTP